MKPTRELISELLKERSKYAKVFGLHESRIVYNPLITLHIKGIKNNIPTLKPRLTGFLYFKDYI